MLKLIKSIVKLQIEKIVKKQHRFVFTHVPKCAGSSLSSALLDGLYSPLIKHSHLTVGIDGELALKASEITGIYDQKIRQVHIATYLASNKKVFVSGHCYATPALVQAFKENWNFITVLREPIDRFISEYVYNTYKKESWKKNTLTIDEYIAKDRMLKSGMTYARFFSGLDFQDIKNSPDFAVDLAIDNLKNYYKVGFLENLQVWVDELNSEFDAKIKINHSNSSPNKPIVAEIYNDPSKIQRIRELCQIDLRIYDGIKKHIEGGIKTQ
ncbi:sulfotransferase family 2 domain-containing protein [Alteromonas sp. A081]|uniref:sulfotransferase family 2 domain-containing protein n=1 Tax=Alteromonas sp. A081 TaxID=3410269 RepID=UPI003B980593